MTTTTNHDETLKDENNEITTTCCYLRTHNTNTYTKKLMKMTEVKKVTSNMTDVMKPRTNNGKGHDGSVETEAISPTNKNTKEEINICYTKNKKDAKNITMSST